MSVERTVFRVSEQEAGLRLDEILADHYLTLSRTKLRLAIREGRVAVNGAAAAQGDRLADGDEVTIEVDPSTPNAMQPEEIPLEVPHDDEWLAVVEKPPGMLVHPTRGVKGGTLANALAWRWNRGLGKPVRPVFVNRLDKPTSGLVLVEKVRGVARRIGEIEKEYTALLAGQVAENCVIEAPIARVSEIRPHWRAWPSGKAARSELRVVERREAKTLVRLVPVTGRTNQLRIHCAEIGHPIVGDTEYGGPAAERLCLHASKVGFRHPVTGEQVLVESVCGAEPSSAEEPRSDFSEFR